MKTFHIRNIAVALVIGVSALLFSAVDTNAQSRREIERERERQSSRYYRQQQRRDNDFQSRNQGMTRRDVNILLLQGYENGLQAGRYDRGRGKFNASNVYRGSGSGPNPAVDTSSADYLYRKGYLEGYEDGYSGRKRY